MQGGRFVLSGGIDEQRQQFAALWNGLQPILPPPSDAVKTRKLDSVSVSGA